MSIELNYGKQDLIIVTPLFYGWSVHYYKHSGFWSLHDRDNRVRKTGLTKVVSGSILIVSGYTHN